MPRHPLWPLAVVLGGATPLAAQGVGALAFEPYALSNGLEVILAPEHSSQVVGITLWYDAGSRHEPPTKAGLARLFERLMFAGSAGVPEGGHAMVTGDLGGRVSATVDEELARFTTVLPSSRLALGLWLEAERMRSLAITDTTVADARLGLLEDLRNRMDGDPYTAAIAGAVASLNDSTGCAAYAHSPDGTLQTITSLTTADARTFFRERYAPNRARLVIAGDLDPVLTRQLVDRYFGAIPRGGEVEAASCTESRPAAATLRVTDRNAPAVGVGQFYRIPAHAHPDTPALQLLEILLGQGSASRLTIQLVRGALASLGTQGGILGERRGAGAFGLFAIAAPGVGADSLAALLAAQAVWASGMGVTEADLSRGKQVFLAGEVSGRERPADIAAVLQHAATFHGSPAVANSEAGGVLAVSLADLRRVTSTWLTPANCVTLIVTPAEAR